VNAAAAPPRIRTATPDDRDAILAVVDAAFRDESRDASEELAIVRATWSVSEDAGTPSLLELVAVDGTDAVVGHVMAAPGDLDGEAAPAVAPLAVHPDHQGRGIGSALMHRVIDDAGARGWSCLYLLGHPAYYGRFGFVPASTRGAFYAPAGRGSPAFMVRPLGDDSAVASLVVDEAALREYRYCWELG
jgi:putative acetyltransferase